MKRPFPEHQTADAERRQQVALFRYGIIADLIHLERGQRGLHAKLREKAAREWDIPGSRRRKVEVETLRGWLADYRRGGFDALVHRRRVDLNHVAFAPAVFGRFTLSALTLSRRLCTRWVVFFVTIRDPVLPYVIPREFRGAADPTLAKC